MKFWKEFKIVSICTILGTILFVCLAPLIIGYKTKLDQIHLLCEIDHKALLKACRDLSKMVANGEIEDRTYRLHWRFRYSEAETKIPQPILDLKPDFVMIGPRGRVRIIDRFMVYRGFNAYPEDFKPSRNFRGGNIELIPGLWYFDELYDNLPPPESEKLIKAFIEKHKEKK